MKTYTVNCKGLTPLLMHADDVEWADQMEAWKNDPANKKQSRAGDDRTPAWRWIGYLWHDGEVVGVPAEALTKALMKAGSRVLVPGGRNGKTFKEGAVAGMQVVEPLAPLLVRHSRLALSSVKPLLEEPSFGEHAKAVRELGFVLSVKRATVGPSKHVRVRPRFDDWSLTFSVSVWDDQITREVLTSFTQIAGTLGIGDWRPSAPKSPGPYGRFEVTVK
jgi:hypothetical protein